MSILGASVDYDVPFGVSSRLTITPRIRRLSLNQDAINENGSNPIWSVNTGNSNAQAVISTVATSFSHDFIFGNGRSVTTTLNAELKHQSGDTTIGTTATLGSNSPVYTLSSVPQDPNAATLGASVSSVLYSFYGGVNVVSELEYSTTRSSNATDNVCLAELTVEF